MVHLFDFSANHYPIEQPNQQIDKQYCDDYAEHIEARAPPFKVAASSNPADKDDAEMQGSIEGKWSGFVTVKQPREATNDAVGCINQPLN